MDVTLYETKDDIPEEVPSGTYVVIDVLAFSTSVVTLFEEGVASLAPFKQGTDSVEYTRPDGTVLNGTEPNEDMTPKYGGDFVNSPTHIKKISAEFDEDDVTFQDTHVSLSSANGAKTVKMVQDAADAVLIGSTVNAKAVAKRLREMKAETVHIVACGSRGDPVVEDHVGAGLIAHYLTDEKINRAEEAVYMQTLNRAEAMQETSHPSREGDAEVCSQFSTKEIVPELVNDVLLPFTPDGSVAGKHYTEITL